MGAQTPLPAPMAEFIESGRAQQTPPVPPGVAINAATRGMCPAATSAAEHTASACQLCPIPEEDTCDIAAGLAALMTADEEVAMYMQADLLTADEEAAWHLFACSDDDPA